MRIAYLAHVNGGSHSGVALKVAGQLEQWRSSGRHARAFIATRDEPDPWRKRAGDAVVCRYDGVMSRLRAMAALVRAIRRFDPDVVYLRWDLFYPPMLWLPEHSPLVVEVNTDDLSEFALTSGVRSRYNALTRSIMLRRARALVFVTSELSNLPSFGRYPGLHRVITNGIDLDGYPELPPPARKGPRLVFVGTAGQTWQGVDKLLTLAAVRSDWQFDIVGMLQASSESPTNVSWHGHLERDGLLGVLARADVGVGTLALHRKSMTEACPLKVREYLAVGLPVIHGYYDPDLDVLDAYTVRIANSETNVLDELPRIEEFVRRSHGLRVPRSKVGHIHVARKEEQRLALFDEIAND